MSDLDRAVTALLDRPLAPAPDLEALQRRARAYRRRRTAVVGLALVLLLVAGATVVPRLGDDGSDTTVIGPAGDIPAGWTTFTSLGLTVAYPPGWRVADAPLNEDRTAVEFILVVNDAPVREPFGSWWAEELAAEIAERGLDAIHEIPPDAAAVVVLPPDGDRVGGGSYSGPDASAADRELARAISETVRWREPTAEEVRKALERQADHEQQKTGAEAELEAQLDAEGPQRVAELTTAGGVRLVLEGGPSCYRLHAENAPFNERNRYTGVGCDVERPDDGSIRVARRSFGPPAIVVFRAGPAATKFDVAATGALVSDYDPATGWGVITGEGDITGVIAYDANGDGVGSVDLR